MIEEWDFTREDFIEYIKEQGEIYKANDFSKEEILSGSADNNYVNFSGFTNSYEILK